jgi:hypothetical protein
MEGCTSGYESVYCKTEGNCPGRRHLEFLRLRRRRGVFFQHVHLRSGRIVALHDCPPALYQIHEESRCRLLWNGDATEPRARAHRGPHGAAAARQSVCPRAHTPVRQPPRPRESAAERRATGWNADSRRAFNCAGAGPDRRPRGGGRPSPRLPARGGPYVRVVLSATVC